MSLKCLGRLGPYSIARGAVVGTAAWRRQDEFAGLCGHGCGVRTARRRGAAMAGPRHCRFFRCVHRRHAALAQCCASGDPRLLALTGTSQPYNDQDASYGRFRAIAAGPHRTHERHPGIPCDRTCHPGLWSCSPLLQRAKGSPACRTLVSMFGLTGPGIQHGEAVRQD